MAQEETIHAHVEENGEGTYAVTVNVSGHVIKGDEPVALGGAGKGPSPYDLLLAALGECTAMTVRWYALRQNWPLEKVEVKLMYTKIDKKDIFEKHIILHGNSLTDIQKAKLVEIAAKCPVQRTLESDIAIHTA